MLVSRAFAAAPVRGWLAGLLGVAMLLGFAASSAGDLPKDRPNPRAARGLTPATVPVQHVMNRNRVIMFITDAGEIGALASSVAGGGFWITQNNQYVFSSGVNMGAEIPRAGGGAGRDTVVAIGGPFSELARGSLVFPGLDVFWDSTDPQDAANFPEVCTVDDFRIAKFPALQPFRGLPFPGFADQTVCIAANDITGSTCSACGGRRLGMETANTYFVFSVPSVQDFFFAALRVFNRTNFLNATNAPAQPPGPYDLENTIVAFAEDGDVGDATDDQAAFFPDIQTMAFWDVDFQEDAFDGTPGFQGITALDFGNDPVTGAPLQLASFTLFTNGAPRPDPRSRQEWYQGMAGDPSFVLREVSPRDVRGMVSSNKFRLPAGQFVELYVAYFFANVSGAPPAQLFAEDFTRPGANDDPAFAEFRTVQRTAVAVFRAGFVVPTAPPKPDFTLIPGDRQVTIVWGQNAVTAVNPFAQVARDPFARLGTGQPDPNAPPTGQVVAPGTIVFIPGRGFITAEEAGVVGAAITNVAFNPNFVIRDFQGFRVYRSRTGSPEDVELIFQVDIPDAITEGEFCLEAIAIFDEEGTFIQAVCTVRAFFNIGTNTGLSFGVVDRGGAFPDPSQGPGLINGIPVFYSVTAFSVNCGVLQGGSAIAVPAENLGTLLPPAACLTLESGLLPFKSATPRSESSAFQPAAARVEALKADGSVCNTDEPTATVNETTGKYTDLVDCSNALVGVDLLATRAANIPSGEFFLEIDRIEADCIPGPAPNCYTLAPADVNNRVFFHWEKADGSPATEIVPQSGFFAQHYGFAVPTSETAVSFSLDTNPSDVGGDLLMSLVFAGDFGVNEDLEVNGQSVHLGELGGTHIGEARPHAVQNSSLADIVAMGWPRGGAVNANMREYSHPSFYGMGGTHYELTWAVSGGNFTGTMRQLPNGPEIPIGGQPRNATNHSTAGDFTAGWNWCFTPPGTPATVIPNHTPPRAGPCVPNNTLQLAVGNTFSIFVPGNVVYIQGLRRLPAAGEKWTFRLDTGFQRALFGREGTPANNPTPPFSYHDLNTSAEIGAPVNGPIQFEHGLVNVYPGMRWKLTTSGGSNELAQADLSAVRVVPNPFIAVNEITRGRGLQRILFTNLPPQATLRIYTISGNLVRVLEHNEGGICIEICSGTAEWDVRSRFDLLVASGNYYLHVTTPDGRTHLTRFAVIN